MKAKTDKALKAFYGTRDIARPQEVFTPAHLVQPLLDVWGGIDLDPCAHIDSPVSQIAAHRWYGTACAWDDKGVPKTWDGHGLVGVWEDRTYCNPPFGDLKAWLAHDNSSHHDGLRIAVLMPARLQRPWLRSYLSGRVTVALNSVKFHGYDAAFPQALLMVISGMDREHVARRYEELGLGERI